MARTGEPCEVPTTAAVVFFHEKNCVAAVVVLNVEVLAPIVRERLVAGFVRADHAEDVATVPHVPSPRQNVKDVAPVPELRFATGRFPVMSAVRLTRLLVTV